MDSENKHPRITDEEKEAADTKFAKEAPTTHAWLWEDITKPESVTYNQLLNMSGRMWEDDKIWITDPAEKLFKQHLEAMTEEERAKHDASHRLGQEFDMLQIQCKLMKGLNWKLYSMTLAELDEWVEAANKAEKVV